MKHRDEELHKVQDKLPILISDANTLKYADGQVEVLDRRKFPFHREWVTCTDYEATAKAIEDMVIQGAIGVAVAAGLGYVQAAYAARDLTVEERHEYLEKAAERLRNTRPTGQRLWVLLHELEEITEKHCGSADLEDKLLEHVREYLAYFDHVSRETGRHAASLLDDGDTILTHCYAAGAVLWMLHFAREAGKKISVYSCETRPYLQGAKLTAPSIHEMGIPVTLITDSMSAYMMASGKITKYVTAADAVAMDGSIANKVGTFLHAIAAHAHGIPFFVLAYEGVDPNIPTGVDIVIEQRDPAEVREVNGVPTTIPELQAEYPAFDVTPPEYISAIVCANGVFAPSDIRNHVMVEKRPQESAN